MIEVIYNWILNNQIEAIAAFFGLWSIYYSVKEKPFFWILAFVNAVFFVYVYFDKKIYALMILQFYYISLSFYGFYYWIKGGKKDGNQKKVPIIRLSKNTLFKGALAFFVIYFLIANMLKYLTDSEIPFVDALITTFSVFAAFLMTKKYIEHWYLWVVSDIVSVLTFAEQEMYATLIMYLVFLSSTFIGFFKWRKEYLNQLKVEQA